MVALAKCSFGRAPLRLGLAGGGSDVPPYSELYGAQIASMAIGAYAVTRIHDRRAGLRLSAPGLDSASTNGLEDVEHLREQFPLQTAAYLRFMNDFNRGMMIPLHIETKVDVPLGSGLGGSSSLVVSLVRALAEHCAVRLTPGEAAELAWRIERVDCGLVGGWQDHYAASFGGFNYMTGDRAGQVHIEKLRVQRKLTEELQKSLILYFGGISETSEVQISKQALELRRGNHDTVETTHRIRSLAPAMRNALLQGDLRKVAAIVRDGWAEKLRLAATPPDENTLRALAISEEYRMSAAKVCGAGSNRFVMILVDSDLRDAVAARIAAECRGRTTSCRVDEIGATSWNVKLGG